MVGKCLDLVVELTGVELDPGKSDNDLTETVVLGKELEISFQDREIRTRLAEEKAKRWKHVLRQIGSRGVWM